MRLEIPTACAAVVPFGDERNGGDGGEDAEKQMTLGWMGCSPSSRVKVRLLACQIAAPVPPIQTARVSGGGVDSYHTVNSCTWVVENVASVRHRPDDRKRPHSSVLASCS
jgi:hypothetical protein